MPLICYEKYNPRGQSKELIELSVQILEEYAEEGYTLTLRQLYYQLVSRDVIPNSQKSYSNLGNVISKARDAGLIDWNHIEDRSRRLRRKSSWDGPQDFIQSVVPQYHHDLWKGQERRVYVFVEKEALEQVVSRPAERWDCPYFANKGYLSSSSAWNVAHNMMLKNDDGCRSFVVLHLGDHDPSGIDMTRDIRDRIQNYARPTGDLRSIEVVVKRIALNMDQIELYEPPPNPAKVTDSRFDAYQQQYGDESWELDALQPRVIDKLIDDHIQEIVDHELWEERRIEKEQIIVDMMDKLSSFE